MSNRKDHTVKRKHKQEPFEPTVGLSQMGCLHGELPNVLGDYDQQTMVDVLAWASNNTVLVVKKEDGTWYCLCKQTNPRAYPSLYQCLLAAWKARGEE